MEKPSGTDAVNSAELSLTALYKAHGCDPSLFDLKHRLSADNPASPRELLRILNEDGFSADPLPPQDPAFSGKLDAHLSSQYLALALIKQDETNSLHWVVIVQFENDHVAVADVLLPENLVLLPIDDSVPRRFFAVLMVKPARMDTNTRTP